MELVYKVHDKPPFGKVLLAALQQLLAVLAGTIAVPMIVGNGMSTSAALLGAGVGSLVYLAITGFKCPAFLGSSFSFVGALIAAFSGAASASIGYFGIIIGASFAGIIYVILSIIVKFAGTNWIAKVMPPVIIGPVVACIGLTLAPNAVNYLFQGGLASEAFGANPYICMVCGLVALFVSIIVSVYAKGLLKLIPFMIGIFAGYLVALIFTFIGMGTNSQALVIIDFSPFQNIQWLPKFVFVEAIQGIREFQDAGEAFRYVGLVAMSYVPIALVTFAEHIADHKNLGFITGEDYITNPGLHRTLLGDGVGSFAGALFGGCPNTTYGESISCVALSRNASIVTLIATAVMAIILSFFGPIIAFFETIPYCIIGGICIALYGFIAASGLQMLHGVKLSDHKNIFVIASIFVSAIGGLTLNFYHVEISPIACALFMGLLVNFIVSFKKSDEEPPIEKDKEETSQ